MDAGKLVQIIIALLLPPLSVFLRMGVGKDLLINIVLCIFFWVPGILHALWLNSTLRQKKGRPCERPFLIGFCNSGLEAQGFRPNNQRQSLYFFQNFGTNGFINLNEG